MMTADEASQTLIQVAIEHDPNGALATHAQFQEVYQTDEIAGIDEDLRLRNCDGASIEPFKAGMLAFVAKPRSVAEIQRRQKKPTSGAATSRLMCPLPPLQRQLSRGARLTARDC